MLSHSSDDSTIDVVVLSRHNTALHPDVQRGIASQTGVELIVHRVTGKQQPHESHRMPAIVRARNEGKRLGSSPYVMFLDDDVVLAPNTVRRLLDGLCEKPQFAGLAADYLNESNGQLNTRHVAMGAALFRRQSLDQIEFRWSPGKCECLCCCHDLRQKRMKISYLPGAVARHIPLNEPNTHFVPGPIAQNDESALHQERPFGSMERPQDGAAYIFAGFDRRHRRKFQHRFLTSLRAAGNTEPVIAFAYNLHPSELRELRRLKGVEVIPMRSGGIAVPIRRLVDFQAPLKRLPPNAVVAYWDAGDVIFQDRLAGLWTLARQNPDRLLVVAEPWQYPENDVVARWTLSIRDPEARKYAFELLSQNPYFNGGFAAGTVSAMLRYLQATHELLHSKALQGTTDWGDQTAMNVYCHSGPDRHLAIDERWNYCICGRPSRDRRLLPEGRFVRDDGRPISVIHGNGAALVPYAFSAPAALARSSATARFLI
jgi:hypothetical protein